MLRMQNNYAENSVRMRVKKAKAKRREETSQMVTSIPPIVYIAPEVHSWNRFYQDYIMDSGIAVFNTLPSFNTDGSSTCFLEALQAVTLASSANQLRQSPLMVRARRHYGTAIVTLKATLDDPRRVGDDSILIALFLLSLYEIIVAEAITAVSTDPNLQCQIHFHGVLALLQWRAKHAQDSELDRGVFVFFCHIALMSMFVNYEPCDAKWSALESFSNPWANQPLEPILARAVDFKRRARTRVFLRVDRPPSEDVLQLIEDGISISEDLKNVAANIRAANSTLPSYQRSTAFNNMLEISTKTTEAIARNLYQVVRYHTIELILGLIAFVKDELDGTDCKNAYPMVPSNCISILDEICESICGILGLGNNCDVEDNSKGMGYRVYCTFWPMVILLFSPLVEEEKRVWIEDKLRYMGETTGFGMATWSVKMAKSVHVVLPKR
ncbi:C6 zinc finger domain-containing protein [Pochonia chlamydosporia 170]|uniref:C6 zinc finger domain-containing protein n=1 Tax=Pochonia chlamydosporia 170 TaxID=1380566 RepID=A0A179F6Z9_METCM|nr:C6 zinc finger domain-containing protein [Pochonia chlamydosporia 170]OAQ61111.1 C6 zinc finger domain-containing protein [Pochonia chlamydosporia 170]